MRIYIKLLKIINIFINISNPINNKIKKTVNIFKNLSINTIKPIKDKMNKFIIHKIII